jgi:DNA replication protein DnaC
MATTPIADLLKRRFPTLDLDGDSQPAAGQAQLTAQEQAQFLRDRAVRRHQARVDPQFANAALDTDTPPGRTVAAWVRHYLAGDLPDRHSLLLLGSVGTGKTHLAYGALRAVADAGHPRADWEGGTIAETYARLRPNSGENPADVHAALTAASILLLDDLGANKHSDWTEETALTLLDARYRRRAPVIATGNTSLPELAASIGDRAMSRLVGMSQLVEVKGPDRRFP